MAHLPPPENLTGIVDWGLWANSVTNNLFGSLTLLWIFAVFFMGGLGLGGTGINNIKNTLVASMMLIVILSVMFFVMDWIGTYTLLLSITGFFGCAI